MHLLQELERCGQTRSKTNNGFTSNFDLIINIDSLLYLNERLYVKENRDGSNDTDTDKSV